MTVRIPSLALILAVGSAACVPGAPIKPPNAPVRGELGPGISRITAPKIDGPLQVVFASPKGQANSVSEITVVFNQPVKPSGEGATPELPIIIKPASRGTLLWIGSTAARFTMDGPLPKGRSYQVEIPKGIEAVSGQILQEPYRFSFTTERPTITGSEPESKATNVLPSAPITLFFNQKIEATELNRTVALTVNNTKLPFKITELDDAYAVIVPRDPLPKNSEIRVHVDETMRGASGELPMGEAKDIRFRTLTPFSIIGVDCNPHALDKGACNPDASELRVKMTTMLPSEFYEQALSIEPTLDSFYVYQSGDDERGDGVLEINGSFEPGKTYTISLRSEVAGQPLRDVHGQLVSQQKPIKVRYGDLPPEVAFGATGIYWAPGKHFLPVGVLNMPEATFSMVPLERDQILARLMGQDKTIASRADAASKMVPGGKTNDMNWQRVLVDDLLPTNKKKGPMLARATFSIPGNATPVLVDREMQLTDLGLLTKTSPDQALIWATRLSNGAALAGARVDLYALPERGQPTLLSKSTVDAGGLASVPISVSSPRPEKMAVIVESGDDWAYQTVSLPQPHYPVGMIFTGRGVYRPGETLEIKGVVRMPITTGLVTPKQGEVEIRLLNTERKEVARTRRNFSKFGTFAAELPIPDEGALGYYRIEAEFPQGKVTTLVSVDQYRPIENRVFVSTDKSEYIAGEKMTCTARGEHLYGAPMPGANAKIIMSRGYASHNIPGLSNYSIGVEGAYGSAARITQASGQLDDKGTFSLATSTQLPGQVTTEAILCQAEVMDLDRRVQVAEAMATVHPADVYVALENPDDGWIDPGTTIQPKLLVVTPAGERRSSPVHIEMIYHSQKEDRSYEDRVLASCDVTSGQTLVGCSFQTPRKDPQAEDQIRVQASTKDSQGRKAISSYSIRLNSLPTPVQSPQPTNSAAPPPPPPPPPPAPPQEDPPRLTIEIEPTLRVGATSHLVMTSPFAKAAKAIVTVEREGIILQRPVELAPHPKKTPLDFPVTDAMMPYIRATVTAISNNVVQSAYVNTMVDFSSRKFDVEVLPGKTNALPGETIPVEVVVKDFAGKPANGVEVTLWGVDEGSLMVTYYRTPDPAYELFAFRNHLVETKDARDELLTTWMGRHRTKAPSIRMGATSTSPRRGDFRQTVVFLPDLVTDRSGRVKRKITLPDGLTAYRFMAVAIAEDDRVGSGDASVQTSKPFMAQPTLPRVIRAGDEFDASVVLSTIDRPAGKAIVEAKATGLTAIGTARKTVDLTPDAPVELKFPLRAERVGDVKFSIDAVLGAEKRADADGVDLKHKVISPTPLEHVVIAGETEAAIAEKIANLPGIRPDTGGLSIALSPSPLTSMVTGLEQLVEYPYGCTEQTVSRMVPLLALRDIADAFQVNLGNGDRRGAKKSVPEALQRAADSVVANQQSNGGFGLWPTSTETHPWITAYALWGLFEAQQRNVVVPKQALDRAVKMLESAIGDDNRTWDPKKFDEFAFALDVLAVMGHNNEAKMKALFAQRSSASLQARALLLHAYAIAIPEARADMEILVQELANAVRLDSQVAHLQETQSERVGHDFGSEVTLTAMALRGLLAYDSKYSLARPLANYLLQAREGGRYGTTHEAAWALLALDTYRRTLPSLRQDFDSRVFWGNGLVGETHWGGDTVQGKSLFVPMQDVAKAKGGPLTFQVLGRGHLYYDVTLSYARETPVNKAEESGLFVTKSFRRLTSFEESAGLAIVRDAEFQAGEVVLCEVEVVSPMPRSFVVVEDPLPGGLEPIQLDYREGGAWLAKLESSPANRREKRDDRMVYFVDSLPAGVARFRYLARAMHTGQFIAPPTRAEQMYNPAVFGHTATRRVRVIAGKGN